jgi:hypothetical protein
MTVRRWLCGALLRRQLHHLVIAPVGDVHGEPVVSAATPLGAQRPVNGATVCRDGASGRLPRFYRGGAVRVAGIDQAGLDFGGWAG